MTIYDQLRRDEGFSHTLYVDSLGFPTIGVGHNLKTPISTEAIDQILWDDVAQAQDDCARSFSFWEALSEPRQGVLVNMCFNLGLAGLQGFHKFLMALEAGQYGRAADEMLDSRWASQVGARAIRLARQMIENRWF